MSFRSELKLESTWFNDDIRRVTFGTIAYRAARELAESLRQKQIFSNPSGKIVARGVGSGFRRLHRQSARGERPSPLTGNLANNSLVAKRISQLSARTEFDTDIAPYAEHLIKNSRVLIGDEDQSEAENRFVELGKAALINLLQ